MLIDPETSPLPVVALQIDVDGTLPEQLPHHHSKGQLVISLSGSTACQVPDALWLVPPQSAIWIPPGIPHHSHVTSKARFHFLFIDPSAARMPTQCCSLTLSPLVREIILHLSGLPQHYESTDRTGRLVQVLLDELVDLPMESIYFPLPNDPRLRRIAEALRRNPADRRTIVQLAEHVAMSERSLARRIYHSTGMSFGQWRRQLHLVVAVQKLSIGLPVQQVADELGYDSSAAFIVMFKKALGQSPGQYATQLHRRFDVYR